MGEEGLIQIADRYDFGMGASLVSLEMFLARPAEPDYRGPDFFHRRHPLVVE